MSENIRIETMISQEADMELENVAQRLGISKAQLLSRIIMDYLDGGEAGSAR